MRYIHLKSQSFGKLLECISRTSAQKLSSQIWEETPIPRHMCLSAACQDNYSHLVELSQVLLLRLVNYSQDSSDGLANNTAVKKSQALVINLDIWNKWIL